MTGWRGADEIACTAGTGPRPGEIASIDRLWSAKTKTVVDLLNHFSYIALVLASRRLCSMHRSSDTIAPGSPCEAVLRAAPLGGRCSQGLAYRDKPLRPTTPLAGRSGPGNKVKTASENSEIQKDRVFKGLVGVCGTSGI